MLFAEMRDRLIEFVNSMIEGEDNLFTVQLDKDALYALYLDSFPAGTNEIYRNRREHDCSCCRGFIKWFGNVVAIKDNKLVSIWDLEVEEPYKTVFKKLSEYVKDSRVDDVFYSIEKKLGCHHNFEKMEAVGVHRWDHFFYELPDKFVVHGSQKGTMLGQYRDTRNVFKRSLDDISMDAIDFVLEMIDENNLYRGKEHEHAIKAFKEYKKVYDGLSAEEKELYCWKVSGKAGMEVGRIRNHSIGQLLLDLSNGTETETAVKAYERMVAPTNYKRPKSLFTKKQLEQTKQKITELGYMESLPRRFAKLDDITINDILFCNRDAAKRVSGAQDVFAALGETVKDQKKPDVRNAQGVTVQEFVDEILPKATDVSLLMQNEFKGNLASLIAPVNSGVKSMFQWGNNFSWAYSGNVTDSMKERVKEFGGNVEGFLRFSIQWNEEGTDNCDLDAHCEGPRFHLYYGNKIAVGTSGSLDVDIRHPNSEIRGANKTAVENIVFTDRKRMPIGDYNFYIHAYNGGAQNGARAQIELDGQIYFFDYSKPIRQGEVVKIAQVKKMSDGTFKIGFCMEHGEQSKTVWGVKTNQFVDVTAICYSPNFWEQNPVKVGHQHLMFMLKDCVNDEKPSGIFNEFLVNDLKEHRKVMEGLSNQLRVADDPDQMSGVGFALDKRAHVFVKVDNKLYEINF